MSYARQSVYAPIQPYQLPQAQQSSTSSSSSSTSSPPVFFNQSINNQLTSLQSCIHSLEAANKTITMSSAVAKEATVDFPRLATVLANKKHFDLVAESEIIKAKEHLAAEIAPQLHELILRAEAAVEKTERRARAAKNKAQQAVSKLEQAAVDERSSAASILPPALRRSTATVPADEGVAEDDKEVASLPDISEAQLVQLRAQVEAARRRKMMLDDRAKQLEAEADILAACR
ncbi:DASH complex subunit spc19 [Tilletia horrida]|uniref:DASH complex subunit SPC19 n=1 Tax=Tilletia horrida TaxID=155126 RepID=A0AAN6GTQ0_9BASI|nr:DASH complex subunit spc19 [Tilletia horrida]KAK0556382.1 DASH complex subunit spc19 [Tilletia horrida]KAK0569282.1 DASH complex subunit spc19 [Tilletia horrida]